MWRQPITIFTESCTILVMCCLINLQYPNYFRWGDSLSTVLSIIALCLVVGLPILFAVFMYRNFSNLRHKEIESKYGAIYENLNVKKGKSIINQMLFFYMRRILLALVIVNQKHLIVQLLTMHACFTIQGMILGIKPFEDPFTLKMEFFNEILLMTILYCMMSFTDAVPEVEL